MTQNYIPRDSPWVLRNLNAIIAAAFLLVAIFSLVTYASFINNRNYRNETYPTTTGTVVEVLQYVRTQSVRVEFNVNSETYSFIDTTGGAGTLGDTFQLNYNPSNPADAQLQESRPAYLVGTWIGMIGGLLGSLVLFGLWASQRNTRRNSTLAQLEAEAKKKK